jgi:hypothetical protein
VYYWTALTVVMTPTDGGPPIRLSLSIFCRQADGRWVLSRDANLPAVVTASPKG